MSGICEGRVAIVTGAGRGLGREYALLLAQHGAKVVVNDMGGSTDGKGADSRPVDEVVETIRAAGGTAIVNTSDVSDFTAAGEMVQQAISEFGKLDVLINNAGILRDRTLANMSEEEWDDVIRVHLKGTFAPTRHAAVYWKDQFKATGQSVQGRVINTTSASGLFSNPGQANYGAAKAGIASFTIIVARELKRFGVTVNAIAPAAMTRLTESVLQLSEEELEKFHPKYVAPVAVWLASEQSAHVTARVIEAGGGYVGVAEAWRSGPQGPQYTDPFEVGPLITDLAARARLNSLPYNPDVID